MSRIIKYILLVAVVGALVAAVVVLWLPKHRIGKYDAAFATIVRGMSEAQVIQAMGTPDDTVRDRFLPYWDDEPLPDDVKARIKREHRYTVQTFFLPVTWTVGFDENGVVVSKHRWD